MNTIPFSLVYDSFLSKITDDMFLQLTELDTYRMLEQLLLSAIEKFEFPRVDLWDYELFEIQDETIYNGADSNYQDVLAIIYGGGHFNVVLTHEEANILAVYMIVEWLSQQLASVENTRMKYSGSDFKFTSQANHMQKLLQLKKDYEREGFHLQRLYKRRKKDKHGIMRSTFGTIMNFDRYSEDSENIKDTSNKDNQQQQEEIIYDGGNSINQDDQTIYDGGDASNIQGSQGDFQDESVVYDGGAATFNTNNPLTEYIIYDGGDSSF